MQTNFKKQPYKKCKCTENANPYPLSIKIPGQFGLLLKSIIQSECSECSYRNALRLLCDEFIYWLI